MMHRRKKLIILLQMDLTARELRNVNRFGLEQMLYSGFIPGFWCGQELLQCSGDLGFHVPGSQPEDPQIDQVRLARR